LFGRANSNAKEQHLHSCQREPIFVTILYSATKEVDMRPCARRRRGASAVELALLLPVLGLLFVFAVDFARLYYHYSIVTNCARNGALYLSDPTAAPYSPYADYTAAALADASNLSPKPTVAPPYYSPDGTSVQLTVSYSFTTITNYPGLSNPINLTRSVQMRIAPAIPN